MTDKLQLCPDGCYRPKARNADDAAAGCCSKWWAIRDQMASDECAKLAAFWKGQQEHEDVVAKLTKERDDLIECCNAIQQNRDELLADRASAFHIMGEHVGLLANIARTLFGPHPEHFAHDYKTIAPAVATVMKDAQRYHFLRDETYVEAYWIDCCGGVDTEVRVRGSVDFLDKAIDTEIANKIL